MASIFTPCEGGVFAVRNETCRNTATDAFVTIDDAAFGASSLPVTGFDLDLTTSHQFLHTLDKFIYVYSFGDRVGTCTFSGMGFTDCTADDGVTSPADLYKYYIDNRLGTGTFTGGGKLTATKIRMPGGRILLGFLTGMKTNIPNPAFPIVQWALQYHVIIGERGGDLGDIQVQPSTGTQV
jgi:hypothetical protein